MDIGAWWATVCGVAKSLTPLSTYTNMHTPPLNRPLSREALQIAVKRKEFKSKEEKERYKHLNAEFQ